MPRGVAVLNRKFPSRHITYEIEHTVDMKERGATFVEPQHGGAIRLSSIDGDCQVIQKVRATGVPSKEGPRAPQSLHPPFAEI